ncbi:MAG: hypothetical protein ACK4LQ_08100 [Pararhodobacter sp.]
MTYLTSEVSRGTLPQTKAGRAASSLARGSWRAALALSAGLALSGCMEMFQEATLVQPGVATGTIEVRNATGRPIQGLSAGPCCDRWGYATHYSDDLLPGRQTIPPGGSFAFPVSQGTYNVRAVSGGSGFFAVMQEHYHTVGVQAGGRPVWVVR